MDSNSPLGFGSLSQEKQQLLAVSYVGVLQEQLAQSYCRHQKLIEAVKHLQKLVKVGFNDRICMNCFSLGDKTSVFQCYDCTIHYGCSKCNNDEKHVWKCSTCSSAWCENCDDMNSSERICKVCKISADLIEKAKSQHERCTNGQIKRSEAIICWSIEKLHFSKKQFRKLLRKCSIIIWTAEVFSYDQYEELEVDFSHFESRIDLEYILIIIPYYSTFPSIERFIYDLGEKIGMDGKEIFDSILDEVTAMARKFLTVDELLQDYILGSIGGLVIQEKIDKFIQESSFEDLNKIIE